MNVSLMFVVSGNFYFETELLQTRPSWCLAFIQLNKCFLLRAT